MKFYTIDIQYLQKLNQLDPEVFYAANYSNKPYVGIIVMNGNYEYFIPLTSAKPKHINWKNITKHNYIVYEMSKPLDNIPNNWIYKLNSQTGEIKHILSVLEIRKMIPVPKGKYNQILFQNITDVQYRNLLEKEFNFLKPYFADISHKAAALYNKQVSTGVVEDFCCNFKLLEKECDNTT